MNNAKSSGYFLTYDQLICETLFAPKTAVSEELEEKAEERTNAKPQRKNYLLQYAKPYFKDSSGMVSKLYINNTGCISILLKSTTINIFTKIGTGTSFVYKYSFRFALLMKIPK